MRRAAGAGGGRGRRARAADVTDVKEETYDVMRREKRRREEGQTYRQTRRCEYEDTLQTLLARNERDRRMIVLTTRQASWLTSRSLSTLTRNGILRTHMSSVVPPLPLPRPASFRSLPLN